MKRCHQKQRFWAENMTSSDAIVLKNAYSSKIFMRCVMLNLSKFSYSDISQLSISLILYYRIHNSIRWFIVLLFPIAILTRHQLLLYFIISYIAILLNFGGQTPNRTYFSLNTLKSYSWLIQCMLKNMP